MATHGEPGVRAILALAERALCCSSSVADSENLHSHGHRGREPVRERCRRDDGTARRSTASVAGTGADDDRPADRRPSHSSSRSNARANPRRGRALGYRATRTPADGACTSLGLLLLVIRSARRGAHGLVMRRRAAHFPPVPPRCRARAGRATRNGSVRAGRWPAAGACA